MTTRYAQYSPSASSVNASGSTVGFGTDLSQDAAYLSGTVTNSRAFAEAMLTLGRVVDQDLRPRRDPSSYQRWVRAEYMAEFERRVGTSVPGLNPAVLDRQRLLRRNVSQIRSDLAQIPETPVLGNARDRFWNWLYAYNRDAWVVLDPIVSVGRSDTMFEAFSADESSYVRVRLPHTLVDTQSPVTTGTTNIDFSLALERELARVRTYRPLTLTVGSDQVSVATQARAAIQQRIDLPDSWLRGLLEVQAAMTLASVRMNVSPAFVADVWAVLAARRERVGPRSLRFELTPQQPVRVVIEPWNLELTDTDSSHNASSPRSVRVWGRRRLAALAPLLPQAAEVAVDLIGSGMPSYWTVTGGGVSTMLGLSGWTVKDWSSRARFAGLRPGSVLQDDRSRGDVANMLSEQDTMSVSQAAKLLSVSPGKAAGILQEACAQGVCMYLPESASYRYRRLFPDLDLAQMVVPGLEERKGRELATARNRGATSSDGGIVIGTLDGNHQRVVMDEDLRVVEAVCTCDRFRWNGLVDGPCRHLIAVILLSQGSHA